CAAVLWLTPRPPLPPLFPYTPLFRSIAEHHSLVAGARHLVVGAQRNIRALPVDVDDNTAGIAVETILGTVVADVPDHAAGRFREDRKSTRLNSSHVSNSYAVFCLKKK